jgi:hypothetical protein
MKYLVEYFETKEAVIDGYPDDTEEWDDDYDEQELIETTRQWCNRGYGIAVAIFKDGKLLWGSDKWHSILDEL